MQMSRTIAGLLALVVCSSPVLANESEDRLAQKLKTVNVNDWWESRYSFVGPMNDAIPWGTLQLRVEIDSTYYPDPRDHRLHGNLFLRNQQTSFVESLSQACWDFHAKHGRLPDNGAELVSGLDSFVSMEESVASLELSLQTGEFCETLLAFNPITGEYIDDFSHAGWKSNAIDVSMATDYPAFSGLFSPDEEYPSFFGGINVTVYPQKPDGDKESVSQFFSSPKLEPVEVPKDELPENGLWILLD